MRIAQKIRVLVLTLVVLSSLGIAVTAYWGYNKIVQGLQVEGLERQGAVGQERLTFAFSEITHDIRLLGGLPIAAKIVSETAHGGVDSVNPSSKTQLAAIFREMLHAKPYYAQIRLISSEDAGREVVRLDRVGSEIRRVPEKELQTKGNRKYFTETMSLPAEEVYYSQINLNREHGQIEIPHRSMLRVAMPIFDVDQHPAGIVIINLEFAPFSQTHLMSDDGRYAYYVTNSNGEYIINPDSRRTFGFDLGYDWRAQLDFPKLANFFTADINSKTFRQNSASGPRGALMHFRKFRPFENDRQLVLGVVATFEDIGDATNTIAIQTFAIVATLLTIGLLLAFALSNRLTRPIENIARAVEALGAGESNSTLPIERDDELGSLARSFQSMRKSLLEHKTNLLSANAELTSANRDLEHFAHVASHELREPIRRIAALANLVRMAQDGAASDDENLLRQLTSECERALRQITDFRVFARVGGGVLQRESLNVNSVVEEVLAEFQDELKRNQVSIKLERLPNLSVYASLVHLIYRNLVENALKYAGKKGFELRFTAEEVDGELVLGVRNSGSSIASKYHQSVFNLFTRLDKDKEGSGAGLSLCRRAVVRHSGKIWVESESDFVHFKFTLRDHDHEARVNSVQE